MDAALRFASPPSGTGRPQLQRQTLDWVARVRPFVPPAHLQRYEQIAAEFILLTARLQLQNVRSYLDIGCGDGFNAALWTQLAGNVHAADTIESVALARPLLSKLHARVTLHVCEDQRVAIEDAYDVVTTQYVLEHLPDPQAALTEMRRLVAPGGLLIHTVPSSHGRTSWCVQYHGEWSPLKRLAHSFYRRGFWSTLRNPFGFTPAHEPALGDFHRELSEYRLDRWVTAVMRAGYVVDDWFSTSDNNWVLITRPAA